jgi:hypothetical protein
MKSVIFHSHYFFPYARARRIGRNLWVSVSKYRGMVDHGLLGRCGLAGHQLTRLRAAMMRSLTESAAFA